MSDKMRIWKLVIVVVTLVLVGSWAGAAEAPLQFLVLGEIEEPVFAELEARHRVRPVPANEPSRVAEHLGRVDALLVDVTAFDADAAPLVDAVVDLAHRTGVPVVVAGASANRVARWVGLGIDGDLVGLAWAADGRTPALEILVPRGSPDADGPAVAGLRAARVEAFVRSASGVAKGSGPHRINYRAWFLGGEVLNWTPSGNPGGSDQVATVNIAYQVELVANSELNASPNARYLKVTTLGTGMNPGNLPSDSDQDDDRERGWFQERLEIEMEPEDPAGLTLIAVAPQTTESYSSYTETTGWEAGVDGEGTFGLSYGESQSSSTTFGNFRVDYTGAGTTAHWTYRMDSTGGSAQQPYDDPFDLIYEDLFDCPWFSTCLRPVNEMAVSTIGLKAEAVWRAGLDFDETVEFDLWHSQVMALVRFDYSTCNFGFCSDHYLWYSDSASQGFSLAVDFSQVHPYGPDADDDGIPDDLEGGGDIDGDSLPNSHDPDADGDGLADSYEWIDDPDHDGLGNFLDTDSDNDSFLDDQETAAGTDPYSPYSRPDIDLAGLALGRATAGSAGVTVQLPPGLVDPVVIVGPPTADGADPGVLRLLDVANSHFSAAFQEWPSGDGFHADESFSWLVLEPGRYATTSNSIWEAGTESVAATGGWTRVSFTTSMPEVPVVMATLQTNASGQALAVRVRNVTTDGFDVALFTEEGAAPAGSAETVGFLAVESRWGSDPVFIDGQVVRMLVQELAMDHLSTPLLSSFVRLQEETSADGETEHALEAMAALAFGREIFVQDQAAIDLDPVAVRWDPPRYATGIEVGVVRGVTRDSSLVVPYGRGFDEPIVVAWAADPVDAAEGIVRASPVHRTANLQRFQLDGGFAVHFQMYPPDSANWWDECRNLPDPGRTIHYVVAERGSGQVGGLVWEAGSIYSDRYSADGQWETAFFQAGFSAPPSVFSDLQNERCGDLLRGDHQGVSSTSVDLSNDYIAQDCAYCTLVWDPEETKYEIGWLAIQPGEGATVDDRLVQVTADSVEIVYGDTAPEAPTARFTWSPTAPQPGQAVQFEDTSTGVVAQWSWDFGDGTSSTAQNPSHTYSSPGTYLVLQAVSSNLGLDATTIAVEVGAVAVGIFADGLETGGLGGWSAVGP